MKERERERERERETQKKCEIEPIEGYRVHFPAIVGDKRFVCMAHV